MNDIIDDIIKVALETVEESAPPAPDAAWFRSQVAPAPQVVPAVQIVPATRACSTGASAYGELLKSDQPTGQYTLMQLGHLLSCKPSQEHRIAFTARSSGGSQLSQSLAALRDSVDGLSELSVEAAAPISTMEAAPPLHRVLAVVLDESFDSKRAIIVKVMEKALHNNRLDLALSWDHESFDPQDAPVSLALVSHPGGGVIDASMLQEGVGEVDRYLSVDLAHLTPAFQKAFTEFAADPLETPFRFLLRTEHFSSPRVS